MSRSEARLLAPAKVNLRLAVLGKRPDGYHELDTTLLALDLADELTVRADPGAGAVHLTVAEALDVPADASNLAWRAAAAVLAEAGVDDVDLTLALRKRVPAAGGLGGGSSDAAAAALGAAEVLGERAREVDLVRLLAGLGSDCPFFLAARASGLGRCLGRGERVEPLARPPRWAVLIAAPALPAPTPQVYAAWRPEDRAREREAEPPDWAALGAHEARAYLRNDLERAALRAVAGLARWRELLDRSGLAHALLSGSGSSFFALFDDPEEAREAELRLRVAANSEGLRACAVTAAAGAGVQRLD
ncbi:MAG: 4-(cytidine 5'-diphospho)-2-C-methyl-D-erythritol kinase [Planctomycetota bacterium]